MLRETLPIALLLTVAASGCVFVLSPACVYAEPSDFIIKGPSKTGASSVSCSVIDGTAPVTSIAIRCDPGAEGILIGWTANEGPIDILVRADGAVHPLTDTLSGIAGIDSTTGGFAGTWQAVIHPHAGTLSYSVSINCEQDP